MLEFAEAYVTQAWPFALVHALLTVIVAVLLIAFTFWKPGRGQHALAELDSRSQHLRGVIGLFLLVGIAGTFYALWGAKDKLAAPYAPPVVATAGARPTGAAPAVPRPGASSIAAVLAPAFPVGLVGLALTFSFSLLLDFIEHAKRARIVRQGEDAQLTTEALVNRALDRLGTLLQGERTQMRGELQQGFERLEGALRPISDLERTLSASLEPVVRELAKSLDSSTDLLRDQGQQLASSAATLSSAATELTTSARDIRQAVTNLSGITQSAIEAHAAAQKLEADTAGTLDSARNALATLVDRTDDLHARLTRELTAVGSGVGDVVERLRETPQLMATALEHQAATLRHETTRQIEESLKQAREGFARAAHDFASAVAGSRTAIEAIAERVAQAEAQHVTLQRAVAEEAARSVASLTQSFEGTIAVRTTEALAPLDAVSQTALATRERLAEAEQRLSAALGQYETGVTQQSEILARSSQLLTRSTQAVSQSLDALASAVRVRASAVETAGTRPRVVEPRARRGWSWGSLWPFGRGRGRR
jgi:hypothetical protein